jgi:syntaxin 16
VHRKGEIDKIVKQMNDLSTLFREISGLVVEQGTVLDRIDFNVSDAARHTEAGNKEL